LLRTDAGLLEVIMQSPLALVRDRASEGHDAAHAHDDTRSSDFDSL
jgi:hypothetical protein